MEDFGFIYSQFGGGAKDGGLGEELGLFQVYGWRQDYLGFED